VTAVEQQEMGEEGDGRVRLVVPKERKAHGRGFIKRGRGDA